MGFVVSMVCLNGFVPVSESQMYDVQYWLACLRCPDLVNADFRRYLPAYPVINSSEEFSWLVLFDVKDATFYYRRDAAGSSGRLEPSASVLWINPICHRFVAAQFRFMAWTRPVYAGNVQFWLRWPKCGLRQCRAVVTFPPTNFLRSSTMIGCCSAS